MKIVYVPPVYEHFNSIKVRLKLDINPQINQALSFQFHKGTIKTH